MTLLSLSNTVGIVQMLEPVAKSWLLVTLFFVLGHTGRGGIENKHSTDVESPHPPPCVCTSVHPANTGARAKAWCLLIHAEASPSST